MTRFILMDVEGTTTSIEFVHEVLFPYAARHLGDYVRKHSGDPAVATELEAVKRTVSEEEGKNIDREAAIEYLENWIREDRKHRALKNLQGYLWREGYRTGAFKGHVYEDVLPAWKRWAAEGIRLGIYSSGSVEAQKLLFGYSRQGDLTSYLEAHFDTGVGHKREAHSYRQIQDTLGLAGEEILFLSDVGAELDAARQTGLQTLQVVREGTSVHGGHPTVRSFDEITLS